MNVRRRGVRTAIVLSLSTSMVMGAAGCAQMEKLSQQMGVGGTTAAGAGVGAVGGGLIGGAMGGKRGVLIGALAGAAIGGAAGYFYAKNVQEKKSTEKQKREAEQKYSDQLNKTPTEERQQLRKASIKDNKAVAVKLDDSTYQQIDPATGRATDVSYVVTPEQEAEIKKAQSDGKLVKVNDKDVLFSEG